MIQESYYVQDLGSTNGTLVNNIALGSTPQKITPGDQIKIGDTVLPWLEYFLAQKAIPSDHPGRKHRAIWRHNNNSNPS